MDWRKKDHKSRPKKTQICRFITRPGGCTYGARCNFIHPSEVTTISNIPSTTTRASVESVRTLGRPDDRNTSESGRNNFIQWRYSIPLNTMHAKPLGERLSTFVQTALTLLDTNTGVMQEVVMSLSSQGGLYRIKELLDQDFDSMEESRSSILVLQQLLPFFKILTHTGVATSIMLEERIGSIYNLLYGRHGERGVKVFAFIARVLVFPEMSGYCEPATLTSVFAVLANMIDMNGHALINTSLATIADALCDICNSTDDAISFHLERLSTRIRRRLGLGKKLESVSNPVRVVQEHAVFVLPQDYPGALSSSPRHDNDHSDISRIRILPTFAEIKAVRAPYLPVRDSSQLHLKGVDGLLDRHFRLLREDSVGQLRDAIAADLDRNTPSARNAARTYTYENLVVTGVNHSRWKGLQLLVRIDQPQNLRKSDAKARKEWWEYTNRLRVDSLVCITGSQESVIFCTVSELSHVSGFRSDTVEHDSGKDRNMYGDVNYCHFQLQLADTNSSDTVGAIKRIKVAETKQRLVEFPGVLLPSFLPTLQALKKMSQRDELPFAELLAPEDSGHTDSPLLLPPLYASTPGFYFELQPIMKDGSSLRLQAGSHFDTEQFKANTELDDAQATALIACLDRSFALIQGPPGTGKSFTGVALIKVLLAVKKRAKLGPIICVCYTNHALDQLLEHLVGNGVNQVIRMGSRSKSEVLENYNLRAVAKSMVMTTPEKRERWQIMQEIEAEERSISDLLHVIAKPDSEKNIEAFLETNHTYHHNQLFSYEADEDGFQMVRHDIHGAIQGWLHCDSSEHSSVQSSRDIEVLQRSRLDTMSYKERRKLHAFWVNEIKQITQERLIIATEAHRGKKTQLERVNHSLNLRCLEAADIIGVTTTGLARQLDLLRNLRSKVLIVEEAGEVLEAHILTALLPSLEQVILIGDHLQLPPHIHNYDLSRANPRGEQYSLDLSLFERLVASGSSHSDLPFSTLETQRRMHPSISRLIRNTLYPSLKDSPHVETYSEVAGMKKRLFWFDHQTHEGGSDEHHFATTSHFNDFEVGMTVALVTHLVRQGVYAANDIAVLTPYLGQLHKIRKALRNQFEITLNERDVQELERHGIADDCEQQLLSGASLSKQALLKALAISTIDNFQGEEAKVVVISLVRSNSQKKCGFLRTSNRINVLLSRAKHGMYIIGNSATSVHVPMWGKVISMLQQDDNFGTSIELECPRHPNTSILVANPDDFVVLSPEGGCDKKCDKRLNCGHSCQQKCHSDVLHHAVKCLEPCPRELKGCDHGCPRQCGEDCIKACQVELHDLKVELECGHIKDTLPCWQNQNPTTIRCRTIVRKTVPGCQHLIDVDCCIDTTSEVFKCKAVCGALLGCGHTCRKQCHQCRTRRNDEVVLEAHAKCQQTCGKKFNSCSHSCMAKCHGSVPCKCEAKCENFCAHSQCGKKCNEPCAPCASITCAASACPHTRKACSMPCSAPCDGLPCGKRCERTMVCGHQCPTVCGEICPPPKYCQICADQDVKGITVDFIMMSSYGEIDLEDEPCIIPTCGHILTVSSMDPQMEMSEHYEMDGNVVINIKDASKPFSADELKVCATCRGSLRNIARYGRIVRRALLDESTKKFIQWAGLETIELAQALHFEQQHLNDSLQGARTDQQSKSDIIVLHGSRLQQLDVANKESNDRYKSIRQLRSRMAGHLKDVQIREQPYQRVWDLVQFAKRHSEDVGLMQNVTGVLQTRETVQMAALLFRCDIAVLSDFLALQKGVVSVDFSQNRIECEELVQLADDAKQPLHSVEAHMFFAQFCAAERSHTEVSKIDKLMVDAMIHTTQARILCEQYPGSTRLITNELDEVEKILRGSTFYAPMRDEEWSTIMSAMSREFRGNGHWYNCQNGHPFTIGECGMPMEMARCPQCDAPIGGQNHQAVSGVNHATDLERRFGNLHV